MNTRPTAKLRKNWLTKLTRLCMEHLNPACVSSELLRQKVLHLECGTYIQTGSLMRRHGEMYIARMIELYNNLDPTFAAGSPTLMRRIMKMTDEAAFALAAGSELYWDPETNAALIEVHEQKVDEFIDERIADSVLYKCRKCGGRKITHESIQVRCSDEPATLFFHCHTCNSKWRESA